MAADSSVYINLYKTNTLEEILNDFGNTKNTYGPIILLNILSGNHDLIVLFYTSILIFTAVKIEKYFNINKNLFIFVWMINPLNSIYLLSINKDICIVFILLLTMVHIKSGKFIYLLNALLLSFVCKYEMTLFVIAIYLCKFLNKKNSKCILGASIIILSLFYGSTPSMSARVLVAETAQNNHSLGVTNLLNLMSIEYNLYFITILPRILLSLFEGYIDLIKYGFTYELTNIYISTLLCTIVVCILINKKNIKINYFNINIITIFLIMVSMSPFPHHRYIYPIYSLIIVMLLNSDKKNAWNLIANYNYKINKCVVN